MKANFNSAQKLDAIQRESSESPDKSLYGSSAFVSRPANDLSWHIYLMLCNCVGLMNTDVVHVYIFIGPNP